VVIIAILAVYNLECNGWNMEENRTWRANNTEYCEENRCVCNTSEASRNELQSGRLDVPPSKYGTEVPSSDWTREVASSCITGAEWSVQT